MNNTTPNSDFSSILKNNPFNASNLTSATSQVSDSVSTATSNIKQMYSNYSGGNGLFIGLLIVIILAVAISYGLYYVITKKIFLNIKQVSEETKIPVLCTQKRSIDFVVDKTGNGDRRSYTFWVYIHDMSKYANMYKNVFSISADKKLDNIKNASPFVFLDKTNNRMYVRFATDSIGVDTAPTVSNYTSLTGNNLSDFMRQGIVIPYIPLQRWVHVAVVCNANSYKNYIYAYVDGDLVNSTSNNENDNFLDNSTKKLDHININVSGVLNIGGDNNDVSSGPGFSGLLAKVTTFNYELNQKDVYDDYNAGPIGNILAKLGLGQYGVRSPIYKL